MRILSIEKISGTRRQIIPDEGEAFCLSVRDVRFWGLEEDMEISQDLGEEIRRRLEEDCMRRCGALLSSRDYSRQRLLDKLAGAGFPGEVARRALQKLEEAGYVDDARYADTFIRSHIKDRSARRIREDLLRRGIPEPAVREAFERFREEKSPEEEELGQIRTWLERKGRPDRSPDFRVRQKAMAALGRKGYAPETIRRAFSGDAPL